MKERWEWAPTEAVTTDQREWALCGCAKIPQVHALNVICLAFSCTCFSIENVLGEGAHGISHSSPQNAPPFRSHVHLEIVVGTIFSPVSPKPPPPPSPIAPHPWRIKNSLGHGVGSQGSSAQCCAATPPSVTQRRPGQGHRMPVSCARATKATCVTGSSTSFVTHATLQRPFSSALHRCAALQLLCLTSGQQSTTLVPRVEVKCRCDLRAPV